MIVHYSLVACAIWSAICFVAVTWRQLNGDPQDYLQPVLLIALILSLGFLGLGA